MSEFKVGDKVRVIENNSYAHKDMDIKFKVGDIATITEVLENNNVRIGNYAANKIHITEIEKVTYTNVKQPKIKGVWTSATTSRVILLILIALLVPSLILGGLHSISSSILTVLTFIALVNDEMCMYEFKERKRYRKDVK
ncbi:MAG: hypothetical protein RR929_00140 [Erysipelotrichaceae bacterium]